MLSPCWILMGRNFLSYHPQLPHTLWQVMDMEQKKQSNTSDRRTLLLGSAVLLGALAGSLLLPRWEDLQTALLPLGQASTLWSALWPDLALLCALLLCGFARQGCLITVIVSAVKGFLLSAVSAQNLLEMGKNGLISTLCVSLFPGFLSLCAQLLLGRQALGFSLERRRSRKPALPDSAYIFTFVICLVLTALAAALRLWLAPDLLAAAQRLF